MYDSLTPHFVAECLHFFYILCFYLRVKRLNMNAFQAKK
jgi:hypothetical protein